MQHPDSYSSYRTTLGGSGRVLAVLLLDYLAVLGEGVLVPVPLALRRDYLGMSLCGLHLKGRRFHNDLKSLLI
jgi:hypothetical protein